MAKLFSMLLAVWTLHNVSVNSENGAEGSKISAASYSITLYTVQKVEDPSAKVNLITDAVRFLVFTENFRDMNYGDGCMEIKLLLSSPLPLPLSTEKFSVSNYKPFQLDLPESKEFANTLSNNASIESFSSGLFKSSVDKITCLGTETNIGFNNCISQNQVGVGTMSLVKQHDNVTDGKKLQQNGIFIKLFKCQFCYPNCTIDQSKLAREGEAFWIVIVTFSFMLLPVLILAWMLKRICDKNE